MSVVASNPAALWNPAVAAPPVRGYHAAPVAPREKVAGEITQLLAAVRKFCAENFDEESIRALMESDPPFDPKVWARLGAELADRLGLPKVGSV